MLVHHKCSVTIEENAFLQCHVAMQAISTPRFLYNNVYTCRNTICKPDCASCLRCCKTLQKRVFLNRHCTFVVHQYGWQHAEVTAYCKRSIHVYQAQSNSSKITKKNCDIWLWCLIWATAVWDLLFTKVYRVHTMVYGCTCLQNIAYFTHETPN